MNKIIIISGPTATGKTATALMIGKFINGEIINFDSLLFYKELNIGTAKPTLEERSQVVHHLIDINTIYHPLNAADFVSKAKSIIDDIHKKKLIPILVGGSGFYLQALIEGMWPSSKMSEEISLRSDHLYDKLGIEPFWKELQTIDPKSFQKLHINDHYRVRRAVEHFWMHKTPFSESKNQFEQSKMKSNWNHLHIYLDLPKEIHQTIIQARAIKMIEDGLIDEVQAILQSGASPDLKPLQSIGIKETIQYLNGAITTKEELINQIVIHTRQLAKAQRTWFKKKNKEIFDPRNGEQIISRVKEFMDQE